MCKTKIKNLLCHDLDGEDTLKKRISSCKRIFIKHIFVTWRYITKYTSFVIRRKPWDFPPQFSSISLTWFSWCTGLADVWFCDAIQSKKLWGVQDTPESYSTVSRTLQSLIQRWAGHSRVWLNGEQDTPKSDSTVSRTLQSLTSRWAGRNRA